MLRSSLDGSCPAQFIFAIPKGWLGPISDDLCMKCHYDIRGIDSDKCPECGTKIGERA